MRDDVYYVNLKVGGKNELAGDVSELLVEVQTSTLHLWTPLNERNRLR